MLRRVTVVHRGKPCGRHCRAKHAGWKAPKNRRDPIDLLIESNEGRVLDLIPIRFGRMMQSPFTFYRGSAVIMAADLATTAQSGLRVQACGDAHLLNFGAFATPERNVVFDINDLDETLPGAMGMGRQAADRERGHCRAISPAERDGVRPGCRGDGAVIPRTHDRLLVQAGARGLVRDDRHRGR